MLKRALPEVGNWYEDVAQGSLFLVVSLDEDENSVAIQYYEGEIAALDMETFLQLPLRDAEQPEDWGGPFEVEPEDRFESDFDMGLEEPNEMLAYDESDSLHIVDDF